MISLYKMCPVMFDYIHNNWFNDISLLFLSSSSFLVLLSMPCGRVNCAPCLTVMALKNQALRVKQFLAHFDKTKPFDPYFVVAFTSLPRFIRLSHNEAEEIQQVQVYLLLHSDEPHLSFTEISSSLMEPNQPSDYQVRPLYSIIFHCKTVDPDILTIIITSDCFNSLQTHHEIWQVYVLAGLDWDRDDNFLKILKALSDLNRRILAASQSVEYSHQQ